MDDLILLMNLQYLYCKIYIDQVVIIQKFYRMFKVRKKYLQKKSVIKNKELMKDICRYGLLPPNKEIGVLVKGGYIYREALNDFNIHSKINI